MCMVTYTDFNIITYSFIENCGRDLRTLRLSCCQYINDVALETIGRECTKLEGVYVNISSKCESCEISGTFDFNASRA